MIGWRVGEPSETNAKRIIEFEVTDSGNEHLLVDLAKAFSCEATLASVLGAVDSKFGPNATALWLCDSPEWAVYRYGPGEAYSVEVPADAVLGCDLGPDGKLWIWRP